MTYDEALASLPKDAKWYCSFGNPGEGGCDIHYCTPGGNWYCVSNGPWHAVRPFKWSVAAIKK